MIHRTDTTTKDYGPKTYIALKLEDSVACRAEIPRREAHFPRSLHSHQEASAPTGRSRGPSLDYPPWRPRIWTPQSLPLPCCSVLEKAERTWKKTGRRPPQGENKVRPGSVTYSSGTVNTGVTSFNQKGAESGLLASLFFSTQRIPEVKTYVGTKSQ